MQSTIKGVSMDSMVLRAYLRHKRDYLTPGICNIIKPTAMEKLMPFPAEIHTAML